LAKEKWIREPIRNEKHPSRRANTKNGWHSLLPRRRRRKIEEQRDTTLPLRERRNYRRTIRRNGNTKSWHCCPSENGHSGEHWMEKHTHTRKEIYRGVRVLVKQCKVNDNMCETLEKDGDTMYNEKSNTMAAAKHNSSSPLSFNFSKKTTTYQLCTRCFILLLDRFFIFIRRAKVQHKRRERNI
jgi:hypothetical protein